MNLVNSKDIVADRIRDIQAQAAMCGRARKPRGAGRPYGAGQPRGARRGLAAWAGALVLARPQPIKTVEEL